MRQFNTNKATVQHTRQFNTRAIFDAFLVLNWRFYVLNQGSARAVSIEISKIFTYADPWLNVPPLKYF